MEYIDRVHAQQRPGRRGNDTRGCQDLTREQIQDILEINAGSRKHDLRPADSEAHGAELSVPNPPRPDPPGPKFPSSKPPGRRPSTARGGTPRPPVASPPKSKKKRKYVSSEEGSPPARDRGSSSGNTSNRPSIGEVLGLPERPKRGIAPDTSLGEPSLLTSKKPDTDTASSDTNEEAETESDSDEDYNDRLYEVPDTPEEIESIQRLLQPTLAHYYDLTGFHIQDWDPTTTYAEQVEEIERAMHRVMDRLGRPRPEILRIDEFNEARAVWNLPWDTATYGEPPDLSEEVGEQLDDSGRSWQGGRWV